MKETIPAAIQRQFHSSKARPVIVQEYHPESGWESVRGHVTITEEVADKLLDRGVTMVTLRWHLERHEFPLSVLRAQRLRAQSNAEVLQPAFRPSAIGAPPTGPASPG